MQNPTNPAFDGSFFIAQSLWSEDRTFHFWRWNFSELPDDSMKAEVADLLAKVLLGADPATLSPEELLVLSMGSLLIPEVHAPDATQSGIDFDA